MLTFAFHTLLNFDQRRKHRVAITSDRDDGKSHAIRFKILNSQRGVPLSTWTWKVSNDMHYLFRYQPWRVGCLTVDCFVRIRITRCFPFRKRADISAFIDHACACFVFNCLVAAYYPELRFNAPENCIWNVKRDVRLLRKSFRNIKRILICIRHNFL